VLALYVLGVNEIALLLGGGVLVMLIANLRRLRDTGHGRGLAAALLLGAPNTLLALAAGAPVSLATLFLTFLKIGAVLYGSGYVLLAFLRNDFVERLGWLTDRQLLDAVAIGQITPGPVFTTATFIGYIVAGAPGAALATIGIFLPSFLFVALTNPLIPRLRRSPWMGAFLDGVNVAAVGLMVAVTGELGRAAIVDWLTLALALIAAVLLLRFKINSTWLMAGGGAAGLLAQLLR
jgi:chromate transporter